MLPSYVRVAADKKSGVITVEVDDEEPQFAADLANAHADEITKVLAPPGGLARRSCAAPSSRSS